MKHIKLFENFDFNEDDFDFEEEDENSKLTDKNFVDFLVNYKIYDKFIANYNPRGNQYIPIEKFCDTIKNTYGIIDYLYEAFRWDKTPEKYSFWQKYDHFWQKYVTDTNS